MPGPKLVFESAGKKQLSEKRKDKSEKPRKHQETGESIRLFNPSINTASETAENLLKDIAKEKLTTKEENIEKLNKLVSVSNTLIYRTSSVFPFDLFPDEITIDENQVNIVRRYFFRSEFVDTILIRNVQEVRITTDLFFAKMEIIPAGTDPNKPHKVEFLKKREAATARRIIQGLMAGTKEGIDFSLIPKEQLKQKVEELGKATGVE